MPDYRSPEALAYRPLYASKEWKALRAHQLRTHPLCAECERTGKLVSATVANHRKPHKGDLSLFYDPTNLQSLCKPHHDGPTQRAERVGYSGAVDTSGWPTDPAHPANRRAS